jgi:hypothetical protein
MARLEAFRQKHIPLTKYQWKCHKFENHTIFQALDTIALQLVANNICANRRDRKV